MTDEPTRHDPTWTEPTAPVNEPTAAAGAGEAPLARGFAPPSPPAPSATGSAATGSALPTRDPAYPVTTQTPVPAVALLVVSALSALLTGVIGIPSAVLSLLALRRNGVDPVAAARQTRTGWVVLAVNAAVGIPLLVLAYWLLGR